MSPQHPALDDSVQYLRGVGPARAKEFATLGVHTVGDLLEHFPFRHAVKPQSVPIDNLELGVVATVVGELRRVRARGTPGRGTVTAQIIDGTGTCAVRWFHSPYLLDRLHEGQVVRLTGKVDVYRDRASFTNPELAVVADDEDPFAGDRDRHDPVYPGTAQLPSKQVAAIVSQVLDEAVNEVIDFLPEVIRARRRLPQRRTAILRYHRPTSLQDVPVARRRLAYDEFFLCQLAVQMSRRRARDAPPAQPINITEEIDLRIRRRFPFTLTPGQDRAAAELREDLARTTPMNRMLQADVGTGKTAVAVYAALAAVANRRQVALLAPTEVLAEQHRAKLEQYLSGSRVRMGYLAGSTSKTRRAVTLRELAAKKIDILIGTHALLEPDVRFAELGLVIIDEQQKFGVAQRAALRGKGRAPHTLVLTATPIPRTLAMTVFGDLDVSVIHGAPPGRMPIDTKLVAVQQEPEAWSFVRSKLNEGEQAFIVYPLIEESESLPLQAAGVEVERLARTGLAGYRVGLLHGRMKPAEKTHAMQQFRAGEIQALVATTVVEVGVDCPNATVMVIQNAERYGLSQLHQLRGRIGRGSRKSHCLLMTGSSAPQPTARLRILCETSDGFRIAEEDLKLRGPGELLGTRQHGLPTFKVADMLTDWELLEQARDDAAALLRADPELARTDHAPLRTALLRKYADTIGLIEVA